MKNNRRNLLKIAGILFCLILTGVQSVGQGTPDFSQYPAAELHTRHLRAAFYLPDSQTGYYRGTRFDWSGLISSVECDGHRFFCEFNERQHDPLNHDDICGTAEEFGMTTPPLGVNSGPGPDPFVKIGIGVLERGDDPQYAFWKKYKVLQPGAWNITRKTGRVEFAQKLEGPSGWAYDYNKTIRLDDKAKTLTIVRRIQNTGHNRIETDHYGHNFLKIDNVPAGPDYVLEFPFEPRFGEGSKPEGCVEIRGKSLVFLKELAADQSVWVRLDGFANVSDSQIRVLNRRTGGEMTITTDQPLVRLVFYSSRGVLAPEPFVKLDLAPGETKVWKTTYRFGKISR